ncbi:haloacid dehalogenase [Haloprofundus marisrubri]|uniref:Haloacid dehalogenase n=1 Tax=Haloprofundus marisrubri TaxID=1514971 RepID=A0A0W1RBY3_9EURY|nr:haloacid dehalogenase [Haloprofundus marisrubri]
MGDCHESGDTDWQAVFWDIGGVLLDVDSARDSHRRFAETLVETYDLSLPIDEALETWRSEVGRHFHEREGTEFRSSRVAYEQAVAAVVGESVPTDEWEPLFYRVQRETLRPNPGAVETVERLGETDLHVGVVSDIDTAEARLIFDTFGLADAFDSVTTSESVGWTKPDPAMFEAALAAADASPETALMVGDRYEHDIAGAADAGLATVAYGAENGPAVDYRVTDLREILDIVGVDR